MPDAAPHPPPPPEPPPRPSAGPAVGVFAFSAVLFTLAWFGVGEAGLFSEVDQPPPDDLITLTFLATAVLCILFGYRYTRRRGWSALGAAAVAITSVPAGFVIGVEVALRLSD
jgi:hypothetical protein